MSSSYLKAIRDTIIKKKEPVITTKEIIVEKYKYTDPIVTYVPVIQEKIVEMPPVIIERPPIIKEVIVEKIVKEIELHRPSINDFWID